MSNRYKGGVISATPPTTSGGNNGVASGAWTLEQQMQAQAAGLWPNQPVYYIEDVFSTYLYTGNGSTQTITNGIDLSTKGGLVWIKARSAAYGLLNWDTSMAYFNNLSTYNTDALINQGSPYGIASTSATGFATGNTNWARVNESGTTYASWTFRKQPKFFDVVTYTGTGVGRTISHNLGSTPGCMIIKRTDTTSNWTVYHRSLASPANVLQLESVSGEFTSANRFDSTAPTSTVFTLGDSSSVNASGGTYVAYLFAHNAGGFGLTGTDNVISCGSYAGLSTGRTVTLGYEPQWVLVKKSNASSDWYLMDNMRGMTTYSTSGKNVLYPNLDLAEAASSDTAISPTATGFVVGGGGMSDNGDTYIYIAIRRGPMKVPTSGTSVFAPLSRAGTSSLTTISSGSVGVVDTIMAMSRDVANGMRAWDRLRGVTNWLGTYTTQAETAATGSVVGFDSMTGVRVNDGTNEVINTNSAASPYINYMFKRAPSFFDEVCYTGNGSVPQTVPHNLGVVPELMIVKNRSDVTNWATYNATNGPNYYMNLNSTAAAAAQIDRWRNTAPTSTNFYVGATNNVSGNNYVAYLFATCAGVSKVGSYTGTGTTKQVDCGFTGGARYVLIKRTDSTGDWYVWDSARGIVAGNDPYLLLNSTAAEVTSTDYVDTYSAGFEISSTAPAAINASGGTFIFLAIA